MKGLQTELILTLISWLTTRHREVAVMVHLCLKGVGVATVCSGSNCVSLKNSHALSTNQTSQVKFSLEETKIIDRFSNGKERCNTYCVLGHSRLTGELVQYRLTISAKKAALHSAVNWVWFSERHGLDFSLVLHRALFLSLPSSSTAEAAQGHERLEAKWRPLVYPPWKPSHALSSTWGIWWKPFVSTPLNYQPEESLMLSSDNGSQQPADYSAH